MNTITKLTAATALFASISNVALAETIDFDAPIPSTVAVNYISNPGGVLSALPGISSQALQYTPSAIPSAGQALLLNNLGSVNNQGVLFSFTNLQTSVSMVGNDFGGADPQDNERVYLTLFDTSGNVLASTTYQGPYGVPNLQPISLSAAGIKYAAFTYSNDLGYYSVDNVVAVPEPETYAMMLAGLGLLAAVRRSRKTKKV